MEVARLLSEPKADKDKAQIADANPLIIAADQGHLEIARLLLEAEAEMDKATNDGFTALCNLARALAGRMPVAGGQGGHEQGQECFPAAFSTMEPAFAKRVSKLLV